jgi:hypothetical protein
MRLAVAALLAVLAVLAPRATAPPAVCWRLYTAAATRRLIAPRPFSRSRAGAAAGARAASF